MVIRVYRLRCAAAAFCFALSSAGALAQSGNVAFGGLEHDSSLPVEVTSEQLDVSRADGRAIFTGNVLVTQAAMRLTAPRMEVEYVEGEGRISRMTATGGVTFVNGEEAAEADDAVYTLTDGTVVLTGDVILTQGPNALAGDRLVIDLDTGIGNMEGNVRTIFLPEGQN